MLLCVSFGLTNQVWNYFEYFSMQNIFCVWEFKRKMLKILILGKLGLKLVFWKSISSHSHAFYFLFSMLCGVFSKIRLFSLKCCFFQIFNWSNLFFDQSKLHLKFFVSLCLFRSIETHESGFSKNQIWLIQNTFSKTFQTFFSLRLGKAPQRFFCRFPPNFLQSFSLSKPICLFYPSFCSVFLIFMHNLMVFG